MKATSQPPKKPGTYWFRRGPEADWTALRFQDQHGLLVTFPNDYCRGIHDILRDNPGCEWGDRPIEEPEN